MKKVFAWVFILFSVLLVSCNSTKPILNDIPTSDVVTKEPIVEVPDDSIYNENGTSTESAQPGGTPADEVFDITVSYANWGELNELYSNALNGDKMFFSSVRHLPIYKFDTLKELDQFKADVEGILSIDEGYDEVPSFNDATKKYNDAFFDENTLMLVYVESGSGSFRYGVDSIYHADGSFCIHVKQTNNPEEGTCDMAGWFITVAVPDTMVADCTEFDADFLVNQNNQQAEETEEMACKETETLSEPVFVTDNIVRITFYGYYGYGKGVDTPAQDMDEVIKWLGTFTLGEKAEDILPPGTDTFRMEIEYSDGTIVNEGLDTITVNGEEYYLKHAENPSCFPKLIARATLE